MMRSMKTVDGAGLGCLARGDAIRPLVGERAGERAGERTGKRAGEAERLGRGLRARERERRGRDLDRTRLLEEPARFREDSSRRTAWHCSCWVERREGKSRPR